MKPKYIKDAIIWNCHAGLRGAWVRCSDINYIEEEDVFTTAHAWCHYTIHHAYPYEEWMEEYIGTHKDLREDERFNYDY